MFESQGWHTSISDKVPTGYIDLDMFRDLHINFSTFDIRLWYCHMTNGYVPMNLARQIISVDKDTTFEGRILLAKTSRYNNIFLDYNALKPIADKIVMIGLEEEHKAFCEDYFKVDYYKVEDAYDAAKKIAGCRCMISNQCGLYSIAEMMKTPRMLCTAEYIEIEHPKTGQLVHVPGPCNVIPQGGICYAIGTTAKLKAIVEEL